MILLAILAGAGLLFCAAVFALALCRAAAKAPVDGPDQLGLDPPPPLPDPLEVQYGLPAVDPERTAR